MKNLIMPTIVLLVCSCHGTPSASVSSRANEFSCAMREFYKQGKPYVTVGAYIWKFRGPLMTPGEVEKDMLEQGVDAKAVREHPEWIAFRGKYREGDELHFYFRTSAGEVHFVEGYVLVRNRGIVDWFVTYGN